MEINKYPHLDRGSRSFTPRKVPFAHRPSPSERLETLNSELDPASGIPLDFSSHKGRVKMSGTRRIEDYDCESPRRDSRELLLLTSSLTILVCQIDTCLKR
jgi:hypothetical protein